MWISRRPTLNMETRNHFFNSLLVKLKMSEATSRELDILKSCPTPNFVMISISTRIPVLPKPNVDTTAHQVSRSLCFPSVWYRLVSESTHACSPKVR